MTNSDQFRRSPAESLLRFFEYGHLPEGPLRDTSSQCSTLATIMATNLPPGPELTTGLRKLLEAKDCFVRAALDFPKNG